MIGALGVLAPSQVVVDGAINGLIYALIGMGVVLVFRSTRVINLAAGTMGLPGAGLVALLDLNYGVPYWLALAAGLVAGAGFAAAVELIVVRRLFDAPRVVLLVATIGIAQLGQAIVLSYPDITKVTARFPSPITETRTIGGVTLSPANQLALITVPLVAGALALLLGRTRFGHNVAATADNARLARLSGVSPRRTSTIVWTLGGLLSTITLVLIATDVGNVTAVATLGPATMARALAVAVVAGLVSFPRAVVAGVVLGVVEAVVTFNTIGTPGLGDLVVFLTVAVAVALQRRSDAAGAAERFSFMAKVRPIPAEIRGRWWVKHTGALVGACCVLIAAIVPLVITAPSQSFQFTRIICFGLVALSVSVITGWSGMLSLGQMALGGLSALTAAMFVRGQTVTVSAPLVGDVTVQFGPTGFAPAVLIGIAVTTAFAALLGWGALRARGLLLAVSTFAFAQLCERYLFRTELLTGGKQPPIRFARGELAGVDLTVQRSYYWICLAVITAAALLVARVRTRGPGRAMVAVRDNSTAASAYTINPNRTNLFSFALGGMLAATGGALLGGLTQNINTNELFVVADSLDVVAMAVIGGLGSIVGPFIGALWVKGLPQLFPDNELVPLLSSSIGLLVLLLYLPSGFVQLGYTLRDGVYARVARTIAATAGSAPVPIPRAAPDASLAAPSRVPDGAARDRAVRPTGAQGESSAQPRVELTGLTVRFGGVTAVDHVDLHVAPHEIVGLIGTNGAGKSTLLNAVGGFVNSHGVVRLDGRDLTGLRPEQRSRLGLGRTFQAAELFPALTVHEAVMVALESRHRSHLVPTALAFPGAVRAERRARADAADIVDLLGLGRYADHTIGELSTGTRRIVELAGLLALDAGVLCLDEPTAGVAQRETEAFGPLILAIRRELGAAVIVIEHDMPLITAISDRIYCLEAGRVIAEGDPESVRNDPVVIASYLGDDSRAIERSDAR